MYILSALAALVVVLTRVRLRREGGAGRSRVSMVVVNAHTVFGVLAVLAWAGYLFAPDSLPVSRESLGIVALAFFWIVTLCGLLILLRWLPTRGRHASAAQDDTWSDGPGLSILAHVGMLAGVIVLTGAYMLNKV
ncbi:MAG: hypothetical protein R2734_07875 [Nocardioides sp.]